MIVDRKRRMKLCKGNLKIQRFRIKKVSNRNLIYKRSLRFLREITFASYESL